MPQFKFLNLIIFDVVLSFVREKMENQFIISNKKYSLGKDTNGHIHYTDELQRLLLEILLEFDRVCRKNNLQYALAYGSALGCYNYGGFVPWDDDIDIAINYEDIPKFVECFKNDLDDRFIFECYENNNKYNVLIPTAKLKMKDIYFKEQNWFWLPTKCESGQRLYIDVVAFMGVPETKKEHVKIINKFRRKMVSYCFKDALLRINPLKQKAKIKQLEKYYADKYKDSSRVSQTVIIPFQDNNSYPREIIYPFKEYDFCGHKIYSFNNIEEFCRIRYGEKSLKKLDGNKYIDPYPIKKRKAQHKKAYNLEPLTKK